MVSDFLLDIYCRCYNGQRYFAHIQIADFGEAGGYVLYNFGSPIYSSPSLEDVIARLNLYLVEDYHENSL